MSSRARVGVAAWAALWAVGCGGPTLAPSAPASIAPRARSVAPPSHQPHWSYAGDEGPASWGKLAPEWATCSVGRAQSPIELDEAETRALPTLEHRVRPAQLRIAHNEHTADVVNTGHAVQINFVGGDKLSIGDQEYELLQFHFHTPSEHTLEGKHYPMEVHFVHRGPGGDLAVVAVLIREGRANPGLGHIVEWLPSKKGVEYHHEHVTLDGRHVLPKNPTTYRYEGSLTTPPCSERVKWIVFATPVEAAAKQIAAVARLSAKNNRPIQPNNGRVVLTDKLRH